LADLKLEPIQPRILKYRSHYRIYLLLLFVVLFFVVSFWGYKFTNYTLEELYKDHVSEFYFTLFYLFSFAGSYFCWLRSRLNQSVQVHHTYLKITNGSHVDILYFEDIERIGLAWRSVFYLKMKTGFKYYFSSSLERVDYVWDGIKSARADLMNDQTYDDFRKHLVQYDHHQKRKDWFFRHKLIDLFNWVIMPLAFIGFAYAIQSKEVLIHQQGLYFFRLFMYSLLICLATSFLYSMVLKIWVFDKRIEIQLEHDQKDKSRNLDHEGVIIHRSKIFQLATSCFLFALIVKTDVNMYSYARVKEKIGNFNLRAGSSYFVDNRYNCTRCKYGLQEGDIVFFGKGSVGQILAREGEFVAKVGKIDGRDIASQKVLEVPPGHVALKHPNDSGIIIVKLDDLIGKLQK